MRYSNIEEIKAANRAGGYAWFEPDAMRFFRSRISKEVFGGMIFVSSELDYAGRSRRYTVRYIRPDGSIGTVGDFLEHETLAEAKRAAQQAAERLDRGELL